MAATTIADILDEQILKKQNAIVALQNDVLQLENAKVEYGDDIVIEKWQQFTSQNGDTRVMITNLDRFPLVGFKYLEMPDIAPMDVYNRLPVFMDYTVFKETYPVFIPISRGV